MHFTGPLICEIDDAASIVTDRYFGVCIHFLKWLQCDLDLCPEFDLITQVLIHKHCFLLCRLMIFLFLFNNEPNLHGFCFAIVVSCPSFFVRPAALNPAIKWNLLIILNVRPLVIILFYIVILILTASSLPCLLSCQQLLIVVAY